MRLVIDLVVAQTDAACGGARRPGRAAAAACRICRRRSARRSPPSGPSRSIRATAATTRASRARRALKEKDLTLAIARRVKGVIEARLGLRVLLTRDDDRSVPVDERTVGREQQQGGSVRQPARQRLAAARRPRGASIYVAAFDRDAAQASAGGGERVPTFGGGSREIELVPWDLAQTRHLDQSSAFAELLQQALHDHVPLAARPIERAPLRVLESANMPAVLVELGYLTNAGSGEAARRRRVPERGGAGAVRRDREVPRHAAGRRHALMGRRVAIAGTAVAMLFLCRRGRSSRSAGCRRSAGVRPRWLRRPPRRAGRRRRRAAESRRGCSTSPRTAPG